MPPCDLGMSRIVDPAVGMMRSLFGGYRREIANMSWLFADRFLRVLGNFAIGLMAARLLGPAAFGGISYAQSLAALLLLGVSLGLNQVVIKRLVDSPDEAGGTLGTAFVLQAGATMVMMAVAVVAAFMAQADNPYAVLVAIVAAGLLLRPTEVIRYWFEANVNARRAVIADNAAFLVSGAAKIAVLLLLHSVEAFAWTLVLEQLLGGICLVVAYRTDRSWSGVWRIDRRILWRLVADAWPLLLSGLAIALYMRVDQFVIMAAHGPAETGVYAAAVRLSEIFYVLPTIVVTTFFPRWQALMGESGDRHRMAVRFAMAAMVTVSVAVALVMSLAASPLIHLLYDARYDRAVPVLTIHIWTVVFVSMGLLGNQWYLSHNLQNRTLICTVLGAGSNFAINLLLVPSMGAIGGAIASLAAQIISTFLADVFSAKTRPLFALKVQALLWPVVWVWRRRSPRPERTGHQ